VDVPVVVAVRVASVVDPIGNVGKRFGLYAHVRHAPPVACHGIQHNDTQPNDIHQNNKLNITLHITALSVMVE
jgi:hypothetical protein